MKIRKISYLLLAFALCVGACGGDDDDPIVPEQPGGGSEQPGGGGDQPGGGEGQPTGDYLIPTQNDVTIPWTGTWGQMVENFSKIWVYVTTNFEGWTCRSDAEWIVLDNDASSVHIFVSYNYHHGERSGNIILSHQGNDYSTIKITQKGMPAFHFVYPDGQSLPVSGGSITVKVYSNYTWELGQPEAGCWVTATQVDQETLRLSAAARSSDAPRPDCHVTLIGWGVEATLTISEAGEGITESYQYDNDVTGWDN